MPNLTTPYIKVHRPDSEPFIVQVLNPDMVTWDRTRAKHKWPDTQTAPMLWTTFVAWHAARRTGVIGTDLTYEAWEATVEQLEVVDADGNQLGEDDDPSTLGVEVDPTRPDPVPISSVS